MITITPLMPHFVMPKEFKVTDEVGNLQGHLRKLPVSSGGKKWCFVPLEGWCSGQVFLGELHEALKKLDAVDTIFG